MGPLHGALYHLPSSTVYRVFAPLAQWLKQSSDQGSFVHPIPDGVEHWLKITTVLTDDPGMMAEAPLLPASHVPCPKMVWLEVTNQCNYRCVHCYAESGPEQHNHLDDGRLCGLIDEVAAAGFPVLQFTGGDPTANSRLMELVRHAHRRAIPVVEVYTNGAHLPESWLDEMADLGTRLAISFYSYQRDVYESITRLPGSFDKVVRNIGRILEREIPLRIGLILMERNREQEDSTREFLVGLGIPREKIGSDFVRPTGRGADVATQAPSPAMMRPDSGVFPVEKLRKDSSEPGKWSTPLPDHFQPNSDGLPDYNSCWAGELVIASDGEVYPCIFARNRSLGNVREDSLQALLQTRTLRETWDLNLGSSTDCDVCEFRYACFDCRALTDSLTGHLHAKPPGCRYDPHSGKLVTAENLDVEAWLAVAPKIREGLSFLKDAVLDPVSGHLFSLAGIGCQLLMACDGTITLGELAKEAAQVPGADRQEVEREFAEFAERLVGAGLLQRMADHAPGI